MDPWSKLFVDLTGSWLKFPFLCNRFCVVEPPRLSKWVTIGLTNHVLCAVLIIATDYNRYFRSEKKEFPLLRHLFVFHSFLVFFLPSFSIFDSSVVVFVYPPTYKLPLLSLLPLFSVWSERWTSLCSVLLRDEWFGYLVVVRSREGPQSRGVRERSTPDPENWSCLRWRPLVSGYLRKSYYGKSYYGIDYFLRIHRFKDRELNSMTLLLCSFFVKEV